MRRAGSHHRSAALVVAAAAVAVCLTHQAFAVSPRNPYRTFNLSGINYGSMRWEQTHRNSSSRQRTTRRSRSRRVSRGSSVTQLRSPGVVVGGVSGGVVVGSTGSGSQGSVSQSR